MKTAKQRVFALIIFMLIGMGLYAQEGPAWLPMGNLHRAEKVWTFLEIPNTSIILAGGRSGRENAGIWKSTDGGQNWEQKFNEWYASEGVRQFAFDANKNLIFAGISNVARYLEWKSLWYSNDLGETWNAIFYPSNLGARAGIHSIILIDNKLYVAFEENRNENGNDWWIYSAMLYRLDISDPDPGRWYWEFIMQYPDLNYIMRLAEHNGKLYVFGKDYTRDAIRVFTHDLQTLNTTANSVGTIGEIESQIARIQQQQLEIQNETSRSSNNEDDLERTIKFGGNLR